MSSSMDPETRTKLEKARQLIKARESKEAALLLHTIDHPVARKWEKQINFAVDWSRQPGTKSDRGPMPWYIWMLVIPAAINSAMIWLFVICGGRIEIFLLTCIFALLIHYPPMQK